MIRYFNVRISNQDIELGLKNITSNAGLKGRWQKMSTNPITICDTAHNIDGIKSLIKNINKLKFDSIYIVLGMMKDKDINEILKLLPTKAYYIFTQPNNERAVKVELLEEIANSYNLFGESINDVNLAIKKAKEKASKNDLTEKWNDDPVKLIDLFKENIGKRTPNILENDYNTVLTLMKLCIDKRVGEVLSIYDAHKNIVASGFFLKHKNEITILMSSTDFKNRNNGANTFLIDRAIFKFEKNYTVFNFGGSTIKSVAKYFLSFGAETLNYQHLKYNNLPFLFKLLKQ